MVVDDRPLFDIADDFNVSDNSTTPSIGLDNESVHKPEVSL